MRRFTVLFLFTAVAFSSCHTRRKARKRHEAERVVAMTDKKAAPTQKFNTVEYIALYKNIAKREMRLYGIPASIILAQGILESNNGNSELARNANNHFGIKSTKDWKGKTYYRKTNEDNSTFRSYPDVEASFRDHSEFLTKSRYADLFRLRSDDYKGWARGLRKDGYATNPDYPQLLINLIEKFDLWKYD